MFWGKSDSKAFGIRSSTGSRKPLAAMVITASPCSWEMSGGLPPVAMMVTWFGTSETGIGFTSTLMLGLAFWKASMTVFIWSLVPSSAETQLTKVIVSVCPDAAGWAAVAAGAPAVVGAAACGAAAGVGW